MDFTREPIIETVITPKEGFKIVVRSSKNVGQEEYFVDAVEVVSFGNAFFLRSLEKPKAFLVPASDYEVLEVREARIVLKNVGTDRSIKIGGGRDAAVKAPKEQVEKAEPTNGVPEVSAAPTGEAEAGGESTEAPRAEGRGKRDRRRNYRRRRGRDEETRDPNAPAMAETPAAEESLIGEDKEGKIPLPPPIPGIEENQDNIKATSSLLSSLLTPPPQLISETIERYKSNSLFKGAFYESTQEELKGAFYESTQEELKGAFYESTQEKLMDMQEFSSEENSEEQTSDLAWEFTPESEPPTTPFTEEELPSSTEGAETEQADVETEPSELPPENHRE